MDIKIQNRILLIQEASTRINNWMDCDVVQEAKNQLDKATTKEEITESLNYLLSAISYRFNDRPEAKSIYIRNFGIIETLKGEILQLI